MNHIVLVEPDIPQNTGNIARTCALTDTCLHLIRPLGFSVDSKSLKRAGLDYWDLLQVEVHDTFDDFLVKYGNLPAFISTTKGSKSLWDVHFPEECVLIFGSESKGLAPYYHEKYKDYALKIYMKEHKDLRSLNLANAVSVFLYEVLRQQRNQL